MARHISALKKSILGVVASLPLFLFDQPAYACGPDTDCLIGERTYRIRMPEGHDGKSQVGAIFFMHGYRGTAKGIMRNKNLGKAVSDLGLALVAPKSAESDWAIPGTPSGREPDELEYFDALVGDVEKRFNIDTSRMMASGFSAGGMMTWNLACDRGKMFVGFAPISGTFWEQIPQDCKSPPVNLIHTHGLTDKTVPLKGRRIGNTKQGDVREVLSMYAKHGKFILGKTYEEEALKLQCREMQNSGRKILEICLHPGGHGMRTAYVTRAWKKFDALSDVQIGKIGGGKIPSHGEN